MKRAAQALTFPLVVAACALAPACRTGGAAHAAHAAHAKPAFGAFGLDVSGMDRSVDPGEDFYGYMNGAWLARTEIPADRSSVTAFGLVDDLAKQRTRELVEAAAADRGARGDRRKIGDTFKAYMDEAAIEAKGLAPVRGALDAVEAIGDKSQLARHLGATLRADVDLLNATDWYTDRLLGLWAAPDLERPEVCAGYLVQGGLGMPDRSFYLDPGMAETLAAYRAHAERVLELAGFADARARAARIVALETELARVHATSEQTADIKRGANRWRRAEFGAKAPGLDWESFFAGAGLAGQESLFVWQPDAVAGIARLVGSEPLAAWKEYLAFRALERAAPLLPKAFADESFAFHGAVLSGAPEQQPRWRRALTAVDGALGEAVGRLYVARWFGPEAKRRADAMVANLLAAFERRIDALDWMTPATKARARAKLATMEIGMGHPARWRDYSALEVRPDDALGNAERASLFEYRRNVAKLGRPVDRGEWYLLPHEVNALNVPIENRLILPAAILEAPFFDAAADDAVNYGAMGAVIGHEITHSFDSSGALFDERGRLADWWTPEDLARFEAASAALAAQYDQYEPLPGLHVNGALTLGENIADVAGLATAFDAYEDSLGTEPGPVLGGFTPEQRLYLAWAQVWRSKAREPRLRTQLLTNVHAPGDCRAKTVRNQDPWYEAFDVEPGEALYLAPDERVKVW